jgi:hypothetical protein
MLRNWVATKDKIQNQKKGSFRSHCHIAKIKEPKLERQLNNKFKKARDTGRKISYKWMIRHAKNIYEQLYPDQVIRHKGGKRLYLGFRFSTG